MTLQIVPNEMPQCFAIDILMLFKVLRHAIEIEIEIKIETCIITARMLMLA